MDTTETTRTSVGAKTSSFGEFFKVWLKIGCINFGGPAGQIAMITSLVARDQAKHRAAVPIRSSQVEAASVIFSKWPTPSI